MNLRIIDQQPHANQTMKLTIIFSILFVSMFLIAIVMTEDNRVVTVKAIPSTQIIKTMPSSTTLSAIQNKDPSIQSHSSSDEVDIKMQSGISSHVSNFINAWQLSKVTSAFQKTL